MTTQPTEDEKAGTGGRPVTLPVPVCCAAVVQATCCEPAAKKDCCGESAPDVCGCL